MKLSYDNKTNDFILTLDGDELAIIRGALGEEVQRQRSKVSYFKHAKLLTKDQMKSHNRDLKDIAKVNDELEKIVQKWAHTRGNGSMT